MTVVIEAAECASATYGLWVTVRAHRKRRKHRVRVRSFRKGAHVLIYPPGWFSDPIVYARVRYNRTKVKDKDSSFESKLAERVADAKTAARSMDYGNRDR